MRTLPPTCAQKPHPDCNRPLAVSRQLRGHPFERGGSLLESAQDGVGDARREILRQVRARMAESTGPGTRMQDVAEAVWRAATDASAPLYLPAGADALQWAAEAR